MIAARQLTSTDASSFLKQHPEPEALTEERVLRWLAREYGVPFARLDELEPDTRRDHIILTEIPAPPFMETARAKKYGEMLKEAGADRVWIDAVGNVLAERKGKKGEENKIK